MGQITFIIGNGIGMALDDKYFTLNKGLNVAWKEIKSRNIKTIIYRSLKSRKKPVTENDLRQVQDYFFKLKAIENLASTLPVKIRKHFGMISKFKDSYFSYLYDVSRYFFNYEPKDGSENYQRYKRFIQNFATCIVNSEPIVNVVTLNYDALLIRELYRCDDHKLFDGYSGYLVDGFLDSGFKKENMERYHGKNFGWYIHLHGSPLFYTDDRGVIRKRTVSTDRLQRSMFNPAGDYKSGDNHLILCDPTQKLERIQHSELLSSYFECFKEAIIASDVIVLIGYRGEDCHVNDLIKERNGVCKLVVEWQGTNYAESDRMFFWNAVLGDGVEVRLLDSIFNFDFNSIVNKKPPT
ncbi:MAG: hypothetical protein KF798_06935 [Candidatus Paracaedibacteraceae bacterium]|nr:hypothetical protein [Candidatus Paracaedibacteraceae bacterium]